MAGCSNYKLPHRVTPNLFLPPPYCRKADKMKPQPHEGKKSLKMEIVDPSEILNLFESLSESSTKCLEIKVNQFLEKESDSVVVFFTRLIPTSEQAVIQVVGPRILETEIRENISSEVFKNLPCKQDYNKSYQIGPEFTEMIEKALNRDNFEVTCVPVIQKGCYCDSESPTPPYLINFINSRRQEAHNIKLVEETFRFVLPLLVVTAQKEEEARLKEQCQVLLAVARKFFVNLTDMNDLLREVMAEARRLTKAERCSLFLLDPDHLHLVAKVFDEGGKSEKKTEVKIAKDQGIAGRVAATGELLNIKDAYRHPLFYKGMDEATGFKTRNILCFPIRDDKGIIGVAQLCNKMEGGSFDYFDEEVAKAFSIYCGLSIVHGLMYKKIQDAQARTKLSNEMMIYHMRVSAEDVSKVLGCQRCHYKHDYEDFNFLPRSIDYSESVCYILKMYEDLNLISKFRIKKDILIRFLLYIQRGYREEIDAPYHNWMHAFSVAHFAFLCIKKFNLIEKGFLTDLDVLAFLTATVCHDVDHRGTTNSFQLQAGSVLANLYSSDGSVMERHHLAHTLCTLNNENCNFLECLDKEDYTLCLDILRDVILATDLGNHLKLVSSQYKMAQAGYDRHSRTDRYFLLCLLMTSADLSDQTKEWVNTKNIARLIYDEFFRQGDMEKSMGKIPLEMMDRDKASIPSLQVQFLNDICIPLYSILAILFDEAVELLTQIKNNILCWELAGPIFESHGSAENGSMDLLTNQAVEEEVLAVFRGAQPYESRADSIDS